MADLWSQLPDHLLDITTKLLNLDDLVRFSCVCQNWNSFSAPLLPPNHFPWLVVPHANRSTTILNKTMGFFALHNPSRVQKLDTPQTANRRIIGSCKGGWLITLHENGEIQLFHPFSKVVVNLPAVTKLPGVFGSAVTERYGIIYTVSFTPMPIIGGREKRKRINSSYMLMFYVYKAIMSSACPTTAVILVIHGWSRKLALFRPGRDNKWIALRGDSKGQFNDITHFQENFFAVQDDGSVFIVCGLDTPFPFIRLVATELDSLDCYTKYLVEYKEELLLLTRIRNELLCEKTRRFTIKKRDSSQTKWLQADDIIDNDSALFVGGINDSFTVLTSAAPDYVGGCIYFTDDNLEKFMCYHDGPENLERETPSADWIGGHDLGLYDMTTNRIYTFYPNSSMYIEPMPFWFTPNSR